MWGQITNGGWLEVGKYLTSVLCLVQKQRVISNVLLSSEIFAVWSKTPVVIYLVFDGCDYR